MAVVSAVLLLVVLILAVAVVLGVRAARRTAKEDEAGGGDGNGARSHATSLGEELFSRELRLEAVLEEARQARKLVELSNSYLQPQLGELAGRLETGIELQRARVHAVAPLTGPSRAYALSLVDPGIVTIEASGREVLDLAQRAAAAAEAPGVEGDDARVVGDQARALGAAIDELEQTDDTQREIERMLQGAPPPIPRPDLEPPQPA